MGIDVIDDSSYYTLRERRTSIFKNGRSDEYSRAYLIVCARVRPYILKLMSVTPRSTEGKEILT